MPKILLLGNGLNMLTRGGVSWQAVLEDLAEYLGKVETITRHLDHKPFTLVFEEIFFRAKRVRGIQEKELKTRVANLIDSVAHNEVHEEAVTSGATSILTTNYDYNLEEASNQVFGESLSGETKYSLYRRRCSDEVCVWHIHGEAHRPNSLVLGHDHYSDYVDEMQDIVRVYEKAGLSIAPRNQDGSRRENNVNWVDIFLRSDVHAIGLSLDYTEIDLWWLLSVKERFRLRGIDVGTTAYYPMRSKTPARAHARDAILESFGVRVDRQFRQLPYENAYLEFLDHFRTL